MTISKPNLTLLLIAIIAVGVAIVALSNGCGHTTVASDTHAIDSMKAVQKGKDIESAARYSQDSATIAGLIKSADTLETGYRYYKEQLLVKGKAVMELNVRYKIARGQLDTILSLSRCDSLSRDLDSTALLVWTTGRKVDSLLFVNDNLKNAQDTALIHARQDLAAKGTYIDNLSKLYDIAHKADMAEVLKVKRSAKRGEIVAWGVAAAMTVLMAIKK